MLIADVLCILLTCLKCLLALFSFLIISLYDFHCMSIGDLSLPFIFIIFYDGRFVSLCMVILISILLLFLPQHVIQETMEVVFAYFYFLLYMYHDFVTSLSMVFNYFSSIMFNFRIFAMSCSYVTF